MVSIIIPVYNVEKYLSQCINSILNQTYKDFEIIIVDDGSTDGSLKICKDFAQKNKNIKLIAQKNSGVSVARNNAMNYIQGEYLLFVDPDDYIENECLEILVENMEKTQANIALFGYKEVYDEDIKGNDEIKLLSLEDNSVVNGQEVANMMLRYEVKGYLWDKMFRTKEIKKLGMEFEKERYIQDWFPVFKQVLNSDKIVYIKRALYNYRQRSSSTVYKKNIKKIKDYFHATNNIIKYSYEKDVDPIMIETFKSKVFNVLIWDYFLAYKDTNSNLYKEFKDEKLDLYEPKISRIIWNKNIGIKYKIDLIMWKIHLYKFMKKCLLLKNNN